MCIYFFFSLPVWICVAIAIKIQNCSTSTESPSLSVPASFIEDIPLPQAFPDPIIMAKKRASSMFLIKKSYLQSISVHHFPSVVLQDGADACWEIGEGKGRIWESQNGCGKSLMCCNLLKMYSVLSCLGVREKSLECIFFFQFNVIFGNFEMSLELTW